MIDHPQGRTSGVESDCTGLPGTVESVTRTTPEQKAGDADSVKEVIPGNDIDNVGQTQGIRSAEPFVNTVVGEHKLE